MVTVYFYENGYEIIGHTNPSTCGAISAMAFIIEGCYEALREEVGIFDGEGTGYTAMHFNHMNKVTQLLLEQFKRDFTEWINTNASFGECKIINLNKLLEWNKILKEMDKRGLSFSE